MDDPEKLRKEVDRYFAPKLREVRVSTREAREALDELLRDANPTARLLAKVLQQIVQSIETIDKDLGYLRNRLDLIPIVKQNR